MRTDALMFSLIGHKILESSNQTIESPSCSLINEQFLLFFNGPFGESQVIAAENARNDEIGNHLRATYKMHTHKDKLPLPSSKLV